MGDTGYYPYKPSSAGAIIFMLAFGGSALFHLWQMIKARAWFFTAFLVGALSEFLVSFLSRKAPLSSPRSYCHIN